MRWEPPSVVERARAVTTQRVSCVNTGFERAAVSKLQQDARVGIPWHAHRGLVTDWRVNDALVALHVAADDCDVALEHLAFCESAPHQGHVRGLGLGDHHQSLPHES